LPAPLPPELEPPPIWKLNMVSRRRRTWRPDERHAGKFLTMTDRTQYKADGRGTLTRVEPPALTKKQRNKLKREARGKT
jgi:hypothetical protein